MDDKEMVRLANAWAKAIESACQNHDFDIRCLDWFRYTANSLLREYIKAALPDTTDK